MPFPVSIAGSIELRISDPSSITVESVITRIKSLLEAAKAKSISCVGSTVSFRGGTYFGAFNMNVLAEVGSGQIRVEKQGASILVQYHLSTVNLLVRTTVVLPLLPLGATLFFASSWSGHFI